MEGVGGAGGMLELASCLWKERLTSLRETSSQAPLSLCNQLRVLRTKTGWLLRALAQGQFQG